MIVVKAFFVVAIIGFVPRASSSSSFVPPSSQRHGKTSTTTTSRSIRPSEDSRLHPNNIITSMMMADRQPRTDSDDGDPPAAAAAAAAADADAPSPPATTAVGGEDGGASTAASRAIDFLTLSRNLKTTERTGWVMSGVSRPESIADHSYRLSLAAMIASRSCGDDGIDPDRCVRIAMVHDLAESIVGDITPHCGVSDADKHARELAAMEKIRDVLGSGSGGDEMLELWKEYEAGETPESKLVKDLDKIEMILQALEYEAEGDHSKSLDGFFDGTEGKWKTEVGRAWAEEIVSRRRRIKRGGGGKDGDVYVGEGKVISSSENG